MALWPLHCFLSFPVPGVGLTPAPGHAGHSPLRPRGPVGGRAQRAVCAPLGCALLALALPPGHGAARRQLLLPAGELEP